MWNKENSFTLILGGVNLYNKFGEQLGIILHILQPSNPIPGDILEKLIPVRRRGGQ